MNTSTEIIEIIKAIHAFQGQVGNLKKAALNPFFHSKYAPLNEVLDVISEPLQVNGLCFVQFPTGENSLTTRIMHVSGQWMEDTITVIPAKKDPQGQGSAITYAKRYSLVAILGLNDGDDDGNATIAVKPLQSQPVAPQPPKDVKAQIAEILVSKGISGADQKAWLEANYPTHFKAQLFDKILDNLKAL